MITINVNVTNKIATASSRASIVCGNSGYQIKFTFDSEWGAHDTKTARFIWNGRFVDVAFTGDTCPVPIISNTTALKVGVYAGELTTTTPAHLDCLKSILCGGEKLADIGGAAGGEKPTATSIDLRNFDSNGQIVETYSDNTTKTIIVGYNADGNPSTITERLSTGEENVTTLIW